MAAHFLLLVLALSSLSLCHADVFVSIDCGSFDVYTDENSIVWMGDNELIQNGVAQVVQSSNSISHVMDTLRVFTSRKKNCYSVKAEKGGQVLLRASFFYGNYDKKSSPPTFDLQFDGNDWATVETSSTELVYYEAIYVVKGDVLSVCVAQTQPNQFPFISALEVRSLGSHMYSHVDASYALYLKSRVAYGANADVRYSDDLYDRVWVPAKVGNGLIKAASDALLVNVNVEDNPPQAVLKNAITTSSTSEYIILGTEFPTAEIPIYITMYFSEVTQPGSTQKRSFEVYKNNQSFSDPIVPPYGSVSEIYMSNLTASSNTAFSLVATSDSTLPPLINAMEVFYVSDPLTDGTNSNDVGGLASLQSKFDVLQGWGGDPCLPAPFSWDWLNCSNGATPRVTALYLSSFGLSGSLPDFSSMNALETIDLRNNSLYGPIPNFLGTLHNIKELNLADNQFSGSIPTSLSKNNNLRLVVTGNPNLCMSGKSCQTKTETDTPISSGTSATSSSTSSGSKTSNKLPVILGTTIPVFLVFWAIVGALAILHHKRKTAAVAAIGAGQSGGANGNGPNVTPQEMASNGQMVGKIGQALINEFKVNTNEHVTVELADQMDQQAAENGQYNRNT